MKIDLHSHTNASRDSWVPPGQLAFAAKKAGLDGIAITDHSTTAGWKEALAGAKKAGIGLILGEEVAVKPAGKTVGEIIGLFMSEEVSGLRKSAMEVVDELKAQDAIIVLPHPFDRFRHVFPESQVRELARKVDAIEVFNSHSLLPEFNLNAEEFAEKFKLAKTGGSDAHTMWEVGKAYTEAKAGNLKEFRKAIKSRKTKVFGNYNYSLFRFAPVIAKLKSKLFGKKK